MEELYLTDEAGISPEDALQAVRFMLKELKTIHKALIIPPDFTRCFSYAGELTQMIYRELTEGGAIVHVMPALGTHMAMSDDEKRRFFGAEIPDENILVHHWQTDTVQIGSIPKEYVSQVSQGLYNEEIVVELNHLLVDGGYDQIFSIGQVVPHEVVGMANYSKNIFVGVGGRAMINQSHMLSAICGMEDAMGVIDSPARKLYDYAQRHFIDDKMPVVYLQTVTSLINDKVTLQGLYIGSSREPFVRAAQLSQKLNITYLDHPAKKMVVYLEPDELKTTWVGNKGIYRTCTAIADGGSLLILAPGVKAFGENSETDEMIRKYGYKGRDYVLDLYNEGAFDGKTMCAAHLIQGSSNGRFTVTYATKSKNMSQKEIEGVGYHWEEYDDIIQKYDPSKLKDGWNQTDDGEEFYYVSTPALGLWKYK